MLSYKKIQKIRYLFPILKKKIYKNKLIYLDNAATTHKPVKVINSIVKFYKNYNSNIHRSNHYISIKATEEVEKTRIKIKNFINAKSEKEIIFTKNSTDSINIISNIIKYKLKKNDEIIISELEHHSNIIPWQLICKQIGCIIKILPINKFGDLEYNKIKKLITKKTKIISICHISNVIGTIINVKYLIKIANKKKIITILDGAQSSGHIKIDVQSLNVDFYVFSGHKMFGPTGIGVLYGKYNILNEAPPYQGGGQMVKSVNFYDSSYQDPPIKFESGTPNIAGIIGLKAAISFINDIQIKEINKYENYIKKYAIDKLSNIENIIIYGHNKNNYSSIISFNIKNISPLDISSILDKKGIAVRSGYHCAQPLMKTLKLSQGTVRISLSIYNTIEEINKLCYCINKIQKMFKNFN